MGAALLMVAPAIAACGSAVEPGSAKSQGSSAPAALSIPQPAKQGSVFGLEHIVMPLPDTWTDSDFDCGVPQSDTFRYNLAEAGVGCEPPPSKPGIETVLISQFRDVGLREEAKSPSEYNVTVDGLDGRRDRVRCIPAREFYYPDGHGVDVCHASLWFPNLGAIVSVTSTTDGNTVNDLLDRVQLDRDRFVLPPTATYFGDFQEKSGTEYARVLREAGIKVTVVEKRGRDEAGFVTDVSPAAGTVLRPGDVATVTVNGPPLPQAEQFLFGVFTRDESTYGSQSFGGQQGAASESLRIGLGDRLNGEFTGGDEKADLQVELGGFSLVDDGPDEFGVEYGWKAVKRGTTTLTFTAIVHGKRQTIWSAVVTVR